MKRKYDWQILQERELAKQKAEEDFMVKVIQGSILFVLVFGVITL